MQTYGILTDVIDPVAAGLKTTPDVRSAMDFSILSFECGIEERTPTTISLAVRSNCCVTLSPCSHLIRLVVVAVAAAVPAADLGSQAQHAVGHVQPHC